jgi:hypothetical protein
MMSLSGGRYPHLIATLAGYLKTGIPLVEYDETKYLPCITNDDIGIYLFIPKIVKFFNISLDTAIDLFFYGIISLSIVCGIIGFFLYYKSWIARAISIVGLGGAFHLMISIGDVYSVGPACMIGIIPFFLYLMNENSIYLNIFLFFSGAILCFANYTRAFSGIPVVLFMLTLLLFHSKKNYLVTVRHISLLFCGMLSFQLYISNLYKQYEHFAKNNIEGDIDIRKNHVFWHTLYCGFGFLKVMNSDNIEFEDSSGYRKIAAIDPEVMHQFHPKYNDLMKNEVLNLMIFQRFFVIITLFAKLGVLIFFLLKYANLGLIVAWYYPKGFALEIAYWIMLLFNALYPLVAIPLGVYTINFMVAGIVYGITSLNYAIEKGFLKSFLNKCMHSLNVMIPRKAL